MKSNRLEIFVIVLLLMLTSCKSLDVGRENKSSRSQIVENLIFKSENGYRPENFFISNGNLKISGENAANVSTRIFLKKDEFLFISGRYLGFEIFRIKFTEDSIKYINRIQRNYFYGSSENAFKGLKNFISIKEIQELIYTGLIVDELITEKNVENLYRIIDNKLKYEKVLSTGVKLEIAYNQDIKLENLIIKDHNNGNYLVIDIIREKEDVKKLKGFYYNKNQKIPWEMEISDIKYENYEKTDFNIGDNYYELPYVL